MKKLVSVACVVCGFVLNDATSGMMGFYSSGIRPQSKTQLKGKSTTRVQRPLPDSVVGAPEGVFAPEQRQEQGRTSQSTPPEEKKKCGRGSLAAVSAIPHGGQIPQVPEVRRGRGRGSLAGANAIQHEEQIPQVPEVRQGRRARAANNK